MPLLLLNLDKVIGLVQLGITTFQTIVGAIRANHVAVHDAEGKVLTAEDVEAACRDAQLKALLVGDAAAERIEDRHKGDPA